MEASLSWTPVHEEDQAWIRRLWILGSLAYSDFLSIDYEILDADGNVSAQYHGNQIPGTAPWMVQGSIQIITRPGLYIHGQYHLKGKTSPNDGNIDYMEGYPLWNTKWGYRRPLGRKFTFDLYAGMDNITNTEYSSMISINAPSYGGGAPAYFHPSPGRQIYIGLQLKYPL